MQLELDIFGIEDERANMPPPDLKCSYCGEISVTEYAMNINHGFIRGMCSKAFLLLNHCLAIVKHFDGTGIAEMRNCYAKGCTKHYLGEYVRKPIPDCVLLAYDEKRAWLLAAGVPVERIPVLPGVVRSINEGAPR